MYIFYYVYILKCSYSKPYIEYTNNLKARIERHNRGYVSATKPLLPVKLINYFAFDNKSVAYNFENILNLDQEGYLQEGI